MPLRLAIIKYFKIYFAFIYMHTYRFTLYLNICYWKWNLTRFILSYYCHILLTLKISYASHLGRGYGWGWPWKWMFKRSNDLSLEVLFCMTPDLLAPDVVAVETILISLVITRCFERIIFPTNNVWSHSRRYLLTIQWFKKHPKSVTLHFLNLPEDFFDFITVCDNLMFMAYWL